MSTAEDRRPGFLGLVDSFLQERNIRWLLGVGAVLLFGSSLMLVKTHWGEFSPLLKHLVFMGYTAAFWLTGHVLYWRQGLRRSGVVLLALTVMLLPLGFVLLSRAGGAAALILFPAQFALAGVLAGSVFHLLLGAPRPTFLACYLVLSAAGTAAGFVDSGRPEWLRLIVTGGAPIAILLLWTVFTVGCVRVSRHVFWLAEEHRLPRGFGFFPMILLGTQFVAVSVSTLAPGVPLPWLGLFVLLAAVPVLWTTDRLAAVFQQRTGDLVRPLPWSLLLPLGAGLLLAVGGIVLAGVEVVTQPWPPRPYALVPTAALFSLLLALVARRTGKAVFVWAAIGGATIAYQFSPVFFMDVARAVLDLGARMVREEALPLAFYGLTYLPLLGVATIAGAWLSRRRSGPFARPLRQFSVGATLLLLVISLGHTKAGFPVGLALLGAFLAQAFLLRDRRLGVLAALAGTAACWGVLPFLRDVLGFAMPPLSAPGGLAAAGALMLWPGAQADRALQRLPAPPACRSVGRAVLLLAGQPFLRASQAIAALACLAWVSTAWWSRPLVSGWLDVAVIGGLHLLQALTGRDRRWAMAGLAFMLLAGTGVEIVRGTDPVTMVHGLTISGLGLWVLGRILTARPGGAITATFRQPSVRLATLQLAAVLALAYLPAFVHDTASIGLGTGGQLSGLLWPLGLLLVVWAFDAARFLGRSSLTLLGCAGFLALETRVFVTSPFTVDWLPVLWAGSALVALPPLLWLYRRAGGVKPEGGTVVWGRGVPVVSSPALVVTLGLLALIAVSSVGVFTLAFRVAAGLAFAGLLVAGLSGSWICWIFVNWQLIALALQLGAPGMRTLLDYAPEAVLPAVFPVAALVGLSTLGWQLWSERAGRAAALLAVQVHLVTLRAALAALLLNGLLAPTLDGSEAVLVTLSFVSLAGAEFVSACRRQSTDRAWTGLAALLAGTLYLVALGVIPLGRGLSLFVLTGAGFALWGAGHAAGRRESSWTLRDPFQRTAMVLPGVAAALGLARQLGAESPWAGANVLAMFFAASFYFWRGLEDGRRWALILSGVMVNVSLMSLWTDLGWADAQLYMVPVGLSIIALVQLLRDEIPEVAHDPLRYLGALVILVSPVFQIVGEGSWLHILSLMVISLGTVVLGIGIRVRVLVYAGTAFLVADVAAMVVRGSLDHPNLLWLAGIALGGLVVALAAYCERHRELLLERVRRLSALLATWQ